MADYGRSDYSVFEVEDFVLDPFFTDWVLDGSPVHEAFWQSWMLQNPGRHADILLARNAVLSLRIVPGDRLTQKEINEIVEHVSAVGTGLLVPAVPYFSRRTTWISRAAIIVLFAAVALLLARNIHPNLNQYPATAVITKFNPGSQSNLIRLSDGTSVILKPGASLTYPEKFTGDSREIRLTGDAFFEVHKDKRRPFKVHSNDMLVIVLGTSFMVRSQTVAGDFKVTVNTGKVAVYVENTVPDKHVDRSPIKLALLTPNQQATYIRGEKRLLKESLPVPLILSPEGSVRKFNFNEAPIEEVIEALREAYGVKIRYNEKTMSGCTLTASLADQPLYEKLQLVCQALNASFVLRDGAIQIDGKGCNNLTNQLNY